MSGGGKGEGSGVGKWFGGVAWLGRGRVVGSGRGRGGGWVSRTGSREGGSERGLRTEEEWQR